MKKKEILAILLFSSISWQAQAATNDLGNTPLPAPSTATNMSLNPTLAVGDPLCDAGPQSFSGTNTQSGRIFRDAIPSSCPNKAYPGIFNPGTTYNYETFTYPNNSGAAQCVTINFDPNPDNNLATDCDTNAHASAYAGSYDPGNQSANFLGDVGSSITDSFSVQVADATDLILVVTNTSSAEQCNFTFDVQNIPCEASLQIPPGARPVPVFTPFVLPLVGLLLGVLGFFGIKRRR